MNALGDAVYCFECGWILLRCWFSGDCTNCFTFEQALTCVSPSSNAGIPSCLPRSLNPRSVAKIELSLRLSWHAFVITILSLRAQLVVNAHAAYRFVFAPSECSRGLVGSTTRNGHFVASTCTHMGWQSVLLPGQHIAISVAPGLSAAGIYWRFKSAP
jgi:hypothetical protein